MDGTDEYYLVGLDGQHVAPVDFSSLPSKVPLPLLYVPQYDVLILNVVHVQWIGPQVSEQEDLWAYSFKDGFSEKLVENQSVGRGGIVWVAH